MATKPWRAIQETQSKRSADDRAQTKVRALRDLEIERMNLAQVRRARAMTQATLAEVMEIAQGDVSRLEHRTDAYIGTLRRYVEALGGALRIVAEFPDSESIEIADFGTLGPITSITGQGTPQEPLQNRAEAIETRTA